MRSLSVVFSAPCDWVEARRCVSACVDVQEQKAWLSRPLVVDTAEMQTPPNRLPSSDFSAAQSAAADLFYDMSDEDRDVDIESDDEVYSNAKHGSSQYQSQAEKRAHHNALERKRRDHIKDSFSGLRDSIPSLHGEKVKASRAQILKKAADYIQFMRRKNSAHQQDIDDLKRQNLMLEAQIRTLEKARSGGGFPVGVTPLLDTSSLITNVRGATISAFDGGSGSESSDSDSDSSAGRRKKMKTASGSPKASGSQSSSSSSSN